MDFLGKSGGEKIVEAEREAERKHAENIFKARREALGEINQTLSACSMDIGTAEIF